MSIDLAWYQVDSQEILHYIFHPNWTWPDVYRLKQRADRMLQHSKHTIPVFFDFRLAPELPPGMLNHGRQIIETRHPQGMPLVVISPNPVIRNTFTIALRMLDDSAFLQDVVFVTSMVGAEGTIRRLLQQAQH